MLNNLVTIIETNKKAKENVLDGWIWTIDKSLIYTCKLAYIWMRIEDSQSGSTFFLNFWSSFSPLKIVDLLGNWLLKEFLQKET